MSLPLRLTVVDARGIAPHAASLRELERSVRYPVADGAEHFFIDHGPRYHPFFSTLGEAFFLLALEGERVAGVVVGVKRSVDWCGRPVRSFYLCDLKIAPEHRGRGLVQRMILHGLGALPRDGRLRGWKLLHGAAMRGARGDVMQSARGLHPMRLFRPSARLRLYFTPPATLARLHVANAPPPPTRAGVDLSPRPVPPGEEGPLAKLGVVSTAGRKDLCLVSSGAPWPLVHLALGPSRWRPTWGAYLAAAGAALVAEGLAGPACFAIDERLADHVAWLAAEGVEPGAVCTVYTFALPPALPAAPWIHLATSEI
jgi:hypothetical protein